MNPVIHKINTETYSVPDKPCLRMIEAFPVQTEEGSQFGIRDPFKIAPNPLMLSPEAFLLASLMDGTRTLFQIQNDSKEQFEQDIPLEILEGLIRQLDEELYLDSDHFELAFNAVLKAFLDLPVRPAAHAGGAYEADPETLKKKLDDLMAAIDDGSKTADSSNQQVSLLISPHIDLHRGGLGFAHAYREIQKSKPADLYVIVGTGHHSFHQYMTCTKKDFATPFGILQTDAAFVDEFSRRVGINVFEEEFIHRDEHSIEFQALFLQYVLGREWKGKIVPILCGSFHHIVEDGISPSEDEELMQALHTLGEMIQSYDGAVTVIAGVDMSHVGRRFGHADGAPIRELERVKQDDGIVLDALISGDAESFYRSIERIKDQNNVCGLTPIYMGLQCVKPKNGTVIFYDQAVEGDYDSVVSFASAVFYHE